MKLRSKHKLCVKQEAASFSKLPWKHKWRLLWVCRFVWPQRLDLVCSVDYGSVCQRELHLSHLKQTNLLFGSVGVKQRSSVCVHSKMWRKPSGGLYAPSLLCGATAHCCVREPAWICAEDHHAKDGLEERGALIWKLLVSLSVFKGVKLQDLRIGILLGF